MMSRKTQVDLDKSKAKVIYYTLAIILSFWVPVLVTAEYHSAREESGLVREMGVMRGAEIDMQGGPHLQTNG